MRIIFIIIVFSIFLFSHTINAKVILTYSKDKESLSKELHQLEKFLIDDTSNAKILEKYNLTAQIEKMKSFYILSIKPIKNEKLKVSIRFLLNKSYPNLFFISNKKVIYKTKKDIQRKKTPKLNIDIPKVKSIDFIKILKQIGFEWLAFLFLSIIGLLSFLYTRKKTILLNQTQDILKEEQANIEKEVNQMEKMNV